MAPKRLAHLAAATALVVGSVMAGSATTAAAVTKAQPAFALDNNCSHSVWVRYTYNGYTQERRVQADNGYLYAKITSLTISTRTNSSKWTNHRVTSQGQVFRFC